MHDDAAAASNNQVFQRAAWPALWICSIISHLEALEERYNFLLLKYRVKHYPSVGSSSRGHTHFNDEKLILLIPLILFENPLWWKKAKPLKFHPKVSHLDEQGGRACLWSLSCRMQPPSAMALVLQEFTEVFCLVCFICETKSEAQDVTNVK